MEYFLQFILLLLIIIISTTPPVGVALFLAYSFLIPYCKIGFGELVLQQNLVNTIVLFAVWNRTHKLDLKPFYAFLVFYVLILIEIPFTDGVSSSFQLDRWRSAIMVNLFVPIALWNIRKIDNVYSHIRKSLIVVIIIATIYGLFLTTMKGINPYSMFFHSLKGVEYSIDWYSASDRLFGRISSVFLHPMHFGMFLGCASIYVLSIRNKIRPILYYVLLLLIFTNFITCGIRSVLFSSLITLIFFLSASGKIKYVFGIIILASIFSLIVYFTPELNQYFSDVSNISDQSNISGSNLDMRLSQLEGCFREIKDCFIFGKGHMWHENYMMKNGTHPIILAFESLVFIIICDYGIFGFFIYGIMLLILFYTIKKHINDSWNRLLLKCYIVFYLSYSTITGDYAYMKMMLVFFYLTFSEIYISQTKKYLNIEKAKV